MTRGVPTIRPISWIATIPQFIALFGAIGVGWAITNSTTGIIYGAAIYLIYSFGSRMLLTRAHRRGLRLSHQHRFEEAIAEYQLSYDFFSRHPWLDDYRSVFLMTPGAMSYREMALVNMAFCYGQLGNGEKAIDYCRRALGEFPESQIARTTMNFVEAVVSRSSNDRGG